MSLEATINLFLNKPELPISPQVVLDTLEKYPSFFLPAAILLRNSKDLLEPELEQTLKAALAVNCPDREALANFVDLGNNDWDSIYPPAKSTASDRTDSAIDTFINIYGKSDPKEDELLERLLFNPTPADYFAGTDAPLDPDNPLTLPPELDNSGLKPEVPETPHALTPKEEDNIPKKEENDSETSRKKTIELEKNTPKPETAAPPSPEAKKTQKKPQDASDDHSLMESLSKFFIKQRRYERAYEIISKLSLNYPEKSVYFADQLRFLQKLMINQRHIDQKKAADTAAGLK